MTSTLANPLLGTVNIESDVDSETNLNVYDRKVGVRGVMRLLNLDMRSRDTFPYSDAKARRRYRGSGIWYHSRSEDKRSINITVDVGCHHGHDCCGCVCGLRYSIALHEKTILVTEHIRRNY